MNEPIRCKICGEITDDGLETCIKCFIETHDEDLVKDMVEGGRFHREKLLDNALDK